MTASRWKKSPRALEIYGKKDRMDGREMFAVFLLICLAGLLVFSVVVIAKNLL